MKKLFLGEYLIQKGLISEEDIYEALQLQNKRTPTIEMVALKLKFLTMKQVFVVLTEQAGSDLTFFEVCQRKGFLSREQCDEVLKKRELKKEHIGKLLVELKLIAKEDLQRELKEFLAIKEKYRAIQEILKTIPIFKGLNDVTLEHLAYIPEHLSFKEGDKVITEGDIAESFYCVTEGSLKVTKENPQVDGNEVYITTLSEGDIFGEASIFRSERRIAHITALCDTKLFKFERAPFLDFLVTFPKSTQSILITIIRKLLDKLDVTNQELAFERKEFIAQDGVNDLLDELFG